MPSLGNLWYAVGLDTKQLDAELNAVKSKLQNLGVNVDVSSVRRTIEAAVGATPFNATVSFGNARASLDAVLANNKYDVHAEVIASELHKSIKSALDSWRGAETSILPKTKELRKAVNDALLSAGFEVNINKVKGLNTTINNVLGSPYTLNVAVDPQKLASAIKRAVDSYNGGKQISVEARDKVLIDSIRTALKTEKFPIKIIVDKAEAQDAVRQALQAAGLQNSGFTASDKRAWDAQSRRMEAEARAAAASALAQRRLAGAHSTAQRAADSHLHTSISLGSSMRGNIRVAGELSSALASAYSVIALKNFMQKVVEIGGELEKQKLAMNAILGDEGLSNAITSQINSLAIKSPFGVLELNQYAKQLTAFQIPYSELYDTMKRLADISAAVGVDMGRITLAFGQVRAAKFLKGTELRQFTEANIPLIDMLSKRFTALKGEMVSAGEVMEMISKKEVSFEDVKAVLWELTGEGGKFHNMQEVLSESVQAKWKNLADAVDLMFGDILKSSAGALTSLAETLTALTSKWNILAGALAGAAGAFSLSKIAAFMCSRAINVTGENAIKAAADSALLERRNLRLAQSYRTLTADERKSLRASLNLFSAWGGKIALLEGLTNDQFKELAASRQLTKADWERLIAMGKLSTAQKHILNNLGIITTQEAAQIRQVGRLKGALMGLGGVMRGLGRSMMALMFNPLTLLMTAASAIGAIYQKNKQELEEIEEVGKNIVTAAQEGFKNLINTATTYTPGSAVSDTQRQQGIEALRQAIKDYSPTPIKDINDALVDQDGHVRSLAEQFEILSGRVTELAAAFELIATKKIGEKITEALELTDGGWFNESLLTNAKDYSEELADVLRITGENLANEGLIKYRSTIVSAINEAAKVDKEFAKIIASAETSYEDAAKLLIKYSGKYKTAFDTFSRAIGYQDASLGTNYTFEQRTTFVDDMNTFIKGIKQKIDVSSLSDAGKTALAKSLRMWLDDIKDVSDDVKAEMAQMLEDGLGLTGMLMEDKIGPALKANFRNMMAEGMKEGAKDAKLYREVAAVLQTEGYNKLSKAGKELADRVMNDAKEATLKDLGIMTGEMQTYLTNNPLSQIITLTYQDGTHNALQREIIQKRGVAGYYGSTKTYVDNWTKSGKIDEARGSAQAEGKALKKTLIEAKKTGVGIEGAQKAWDRYQAAIDYLGWGDLDLSEKKGGGKSDELAKRLEQRLKDVKDAYAMYKKWSQLESSDLAFKRVGNSGLFSSLDPDKVPKTADEYRKIVEEIERELNAAGVKGSQRETLLNNLIKERFGIDEDTAKAQLQAALDKVSRETEKQLSNWQLYDKIRKATGDESFAISFAFGDEGGETDYVELIKKRFERIAQQYEGLENLTFDAITDENQLTNVPDKVKEAWEKANSDILKYFEQQREAIAGILSEYQTLQERINTINSKRNENLNAINAKDSDGNFVIRDENKRNSLAAQVNAKADYDIFKQSTEYLQFFNDIYGLTLTEANRIGDLIQQKLNANLQAGLITLSDYEKEMKKVREQLDKVRNVKSNAMTLLTGGVKGLNEKKLQKEEGKLANNPKYQEALAKMQAAQNELNAAQQEGNDADIAAKEEALRLAKQEVAAFTKVRDAIIKNQAAWEKVLNVANIASDITSGLSDAFGDIKEMAKSFGVDTESGAWADIGSVLETMDAATSGISKTIQSAMNGSVGGILGGVVSTITTPFTIWSANHDKKLQKEIERSQEEIKLLKNMNNFIERRMEYFLGNPRNMDIDFLQEDKRKSDKYRRAKERYESSGGKHLFAGLSMIKNKKYEDRLTAYEEGGAYKYQRQLMIEERTELERQKRAEEDKKDSDSGAIADYQDQIDELNVQIRQFAEETAKSLYGIDFKAWAADLGDALMEAFSKGEDAAKAFDDTVADIMRSVVKSMMITNILEPMFEDLRKYLFGENGDSGAFGFDYELDPAEVAMMKEYLGRVQTKGIPAAQELYDAINEATGGILDDPEAKEGLSAGIQGVTEDTADLLASYLNAIRADVSEQTHILWPRLLDDMLPQMNAIAESQLREQRKIAANTLINANAAVAIEQSNAEIRDILKRNIAGGGNFRIS